jgi:hypothetical protein
VSTWIAGLAALAFLGIGLRAVLAPAGAAAFFGLPVPAAEGLPFVQVFGARNVGLSLLALTLLVLDVRLGVAAVFLAAALIAGLDAWIVTTHAGVARALKHLAYVAGLAGFGFLARRRRGPGQRTFGNPEVCPSDALGWRDRRGADSGRWRRRA